MSPFDESNIYFLLELCIKIVKALACERQRAWALL
jgi:hypothetical protein